VAAGHAVTVRDIDIRPEPVAHLKTLGAVVASRNEEAAVRSELVCISVFGEAEVNETCLASTNDRGLTA
jgi:3-hydroxyisobutyrate dehydrogenase-like beta-hydroxyacid dehydrogenase